MYYTMDLHFMLINSIKNNQQTKNDFHKKSLDDVHSKSINDHLGDFYFFIRLTARFAPNSPPRLIWGWRCEVPSLMDVIRDR